MKNPKEALEAAYQFAMRASGRETIETRLDDPELISNLDIVLAASEKMKAVYTVVLTSVVYKNLHPEQDIRKHQVSIEGGYSGRSFDSNHITPFLKEKEFPAMSDSGWLTRSLEQKVMYDRNYPGAIKQPEKNAFLSILDAIENKGADTGEILDYMLQYLIIQREGRVISMATPNNLSVRDIVSLLDSHFHQTYSGHGAARLPVVAVYAVYMCLVKELKRFQGKTLLPLESHTSADSRSGRIGDIDIVDENGNPFEAVEIKFDIPVSAGIVETAKKKIERSTASRYYILSTKGTVEDDAEKIETVTRQLKNIHGCQLVINGIIHSLNYYLRLVEDTSTFIQNYTRLLQNDKAVLFEHKLAWNDLVSIL